MPGRANAALSLILGPNLQRPSEVPDAIGG